MYLKINNILKVVFVEVNIYIYIYMKYVIGDRQGMYINVFDL